MKVLIIKLKSDANDYTKNIKADECTVIVWDDIRDYTVLEREALNSYDYIVVAIANIKPAVDICDFLGNKISAEKIINYYYAVEGAAPFMRVERLMKGNDSYDGIILGISHAEVGIVPELLNESFCNLAISSQDLFYNLQTLKYCIENYPDKFNGLHTVIIDLFDYTYFNFDTSLASVAGPYFCSYRGYNMNPHHFNENKNYSFSYNDLVCKLANDSKDYCKKGNLSALEQVYDIDAVVSEYCSERTKMNGDINIPSRMQHYVFDEQTEGRSFGNGLINRPHPDTIDENVLILDELLKLVYSINPDMRVIFLLLPQYIEHTRLQEAGMQMWKELFAEVIKSAEDLYGVEYYDFKYFEEIANDPYCFHDFSHLNFYGAMKFTECLNRVIYGT